MQKGNNPESVVCFGRNNSLNPRANGRTTRDDIQAGDSDCPDDPAAKYRNIELGLAYEPKTGNHRNWKSMMMLPMKLISLALLLILAIAFLIYLIHISTSSRNIHRPSIVQDQSVSLMDKDFLDFCPREYENWVPCYRNSASLEHNHQEKQIERRCVHGNRRYCLVPQPANYKVPLKWPGGRDSIWSSNVNLTTEVVLSWGALNGRKMTPEEDGISFEKVAVTLDGIEDYSNQIAEMIGLRNKSSLTQAGVRTVLDIGCGIGSFGAHLISKDVLPLCIADNEYSPSHVQLVLERGLPAMISSFTSKQLPYPSLSFDMIHCSRCGMEWDKKDGKYLIEVDRVLRPGGYFIWASSIIDGVGFHKKRWSFIHDFANTLCWRMISRKNETAVWKKASNKLCYKQKKSNPGPSICTKSNHVKSPYYEPLRSCIGGPEGKRWIPIEQRAPWPSRATLNSIQLDIYGVSSETVDEDTKHWRMAILDYWSLLSPSVFSDHPRRPGKDDPQPPYNMVRNVLDMNARFGGFSSALLEAGKSVWVMNVVPTTGPNYLPMILDRGFIGVLHNWSEAFPTYPRTYDMVHAAGLLSLESSHPQESQMINILIEIDRILRPEGWIIIRDKAQHIETLRDLAGLLKWDSRIIQSTSNSMEKLLICRKPFFKQQRPIHPR